MNSKLAAVVLAAGYSSRAPGFKPLLSLRNSTVIENAISSFRRAGIGNITVVTGHNAGELAPVLEALPVRRVFNENYQQGMFSSVIAGLRSLQPEIEGFFLLPADMPLVKSHSVRLLTRAYKRTRAEIIYPVFQGLRGHPPLIAASLIPAILAWRGPEGLRGFLTHYEANSYEVEVPDEGVVLDMDTPADYRRMLEYCRRDIPTGNECEAILAKLRVPERTVRHSRMVASVAQRLAEHLNLSGQRLDLKLVGAAGLLHDLAKGRPDHAGAGAKILTRLRCPQVAKIIAAHTDIVFTEGSPLDEAAVVYLADKLVKYDRIVSLEERFQEAFARYSADTAALAAVRRRFFSAQGIARLVEQQVGASLEKLIAPNAELLL